MKERAVAARDTSAHPHRGGVYSALLVFAVWWVITQLAWLGGARVYGTDETIYAHAAYQVGLGRVLYRELFYHHFPFAIELFSLFSRFAQTPLEYVTVLRSVIAVFAGVSVGAGVLLNWGAGRIAVVLTPLLLLVTPAYMLPLVEIRPDSVAFSLFLLALAVWSRGGTVGSGGVAGALFAGACWSSEKVLCYGLPLFIAALFHVTSVKEAKGRRETSRGFLCGAVLCGVVLVGQTFWRVPFRDWWMLCVEWNALHEWAYPERVWTEEFRRVALEVWPVLALSVVGGIRELRAKRWLLLGTTLFAFLSYALQQAPYYYSLTPFLGMVLLLAARAGAVMPAQGGEEVDFLFEKKALLLLPLLLPLSFFLVQHGVKTLPPAESNRVQREMYSALEKLLAPREPLYDNSGAGVTHPGVHYYFFTDSLTRTVKGEVLVREIPPAIEELGSTVMLRDFKVRELPEPLRLYLGAHFIPLYPEKTPPAAIIPEILVWGMRFTGEGEFKAIRAGTYRVSPPQRLLIDGQWSESPEFFLERGVHRVRGEGAFTVVWHASLGQVPSKGQPGERG